MVCYFNIHTTALLCPLCCENENWGANITPNMRLWNYSKFANINMSTGYTLCLENGGGYTKSIDMGWKHVRWTPHTRLQSPPKHFQHLFWLPQVTQWISPNRLQATHGRFQTHKKWWKKLRARKRHITSWGETPILYRPYGPHPVKTKIFEISCVACEAPV